MNLKLGQTSPNQSRRLIIFLLVWFVILVFLFCYFYFLRSEIQHRFDSRKWSVPSRVFSATVPLFPGQSLSLSQLKQMVEERRYQEAEKEPLRAGEYRIQKDSLILNQREFQFPGRTLPSQRIQFDFKRGKLLKMQNAQGELAFLELEPLEIARLFGARRESRLLINIHQVSPYLIDGVVAIEDHRFYVHGGVDWWGILRALWTDVRARRVLQGGSTITQQLVKNYFLEPKRNLKRKLLEASMAVVIEALYSKDEILEMYMNEIYLGRRGSVSIHGMGEAARYFFGRNVEDLTLPEAAALAGMVRAPNTYSPLAHPDACKDRRNTVLRRMLSLGKISVQEYEKALLEPIRVPETILPVNVAPYFVDYVRQQLQELYAPQVLESEGLNIYTTLQPEMALAAEATVKEGLEELEKDLLGPEAESPEDPLQAVLIAIQPKTGTVLALVGGRDYNESSFNRALLAHRQPGSAIKPFVYLSGLGSFTPVSRLGDAPISLMVNGLPWVPKNSDEKFRGSVTFREALEQSLNVPTVNLAMTVGLDRIIDTLRAFGITSRMEPVPSLVLGSFEVTPLELARAYATLDNDGQKPYLLSLKEVVAENGEIQERGNVDFVSVATPAKSYIVTNILEGAMDRGTGKSIKRLGIDFPCAGKTGTTSDDRDSWFIGYTTDLLVLVWVGYDDNRPTRLTGALGAGRLWARFVNRIRPWINGQSFHIPPGVAQRIICGKSGLLAAIACPNKTLEVFEAENIPSAYCTQHVK
jgi:penicillin-binding protein 1B